MPIDRDKLEEQWMEGQSKSCGIPARYSDAQLKDFPSNVTDTVLHALNNQNWLYICGPTGTGKTHILSGIARSAYLSGRRPTFIHVADMLGDIRMTMKYADLDMESSIVDMSNHDFLCIDDLGVEKHSDWALETLDRIINRRYNEKKRTIISSNLILDQLKETAPRIASRIREMAQVVFLTEVREERK